jgi:hypothetical protein
MRTPFALLLLGAIAMPSPADAQQRWLEEMQALSGAIQRLPAVPPGAMQMPPGAATGGGPPTFDNKPVDISSPYERAQQLAIESGNTRLDASCEIAEILSGEIRFDIVTVIKIPGKYPPKKGG